MLTFYRSTMERVPNTDERRCRAVTQRGRCRVTRGLNADSLCSMHSGATDPRELGRRSGEARRRPNPDRVHESLRTYLQREVPLERVWRALEAAMLGSNESARVAASKVLMDALAEPRDGCPVCREREANAPDVKARLLELLTRS